MPVCAWRLQCLSSVATEQRSCVGDSPGGDLVTRTNRSICCRKNKKKKDAEGQIVQSVEFLRHRTYLHSTYLQFIFFGSNYRREVYIAAVVKVHTDYIL